MKDSSKHCTEAFEGYNYLRGSDNLIYLHPDSKKVWKGIIFCVQDENYETGRVIYHAVKPIKMSPKEKAKWLNFLKGLAGSESLKPPKTKKPKKRN